MRHQPFIDLVVGARPNFMKLAPVVRGLQAQGLLDFRIVHTGQHYDESMSGVFLDQLGLPTPDVHLDAGPGTQGAQTARILERYEALLLEGRPSATVVFGDVNSTIACALAAAKLGVPVAHVEAGLRSFDRTMPEELNRVLTDAIADLLLVSEPSGIENLRREGIAQNKVRMVGNVMIDTLLAHLPAAETRRAAARLGLNPRGYGFVTLHRPSNVDDPATLRELVLLLHELSHDLPLVFAVHPRTMQAVKDAAIPIESGWSRLFVLGPQAYLDSISFLADAAVVLTDSGGIQEEASVLGIPCITLRDNTERPITVTLGTSRLVGRCPERIRTAWNAALGGDWPVGQPIPLWDGNAGQRVAQALSEWLGAMPDSADTPELDGTFRHLEQQPAR